MKNNNWCILIIILTTFSYSQNYLGNGEIKYKETLNFGSEDEAIEYSLIFGSNFSLYEEIIKLNKGVDYGLDSNGNHLSSIYFDEDIPTYTFIDLKSKNIIFKKHIATDIYTVIEKYEKINWTIKNDFKKIGTYKCQKALCSYRGREYTAWFTDLIPIQFGPWKLSGLKGAILEAYDKEKVYYAIATNISVFKAENDISKKIKKILSEKKISFQEYLKKWENRHNEMISYLNSKLPKNTKPFKMDKNEMSKVRELEIFNN